MYKYADETSQLEKEYIFKINYLRVNYVFRINLKIYI